MPWPMEAVTTKCIPLNRASLYYCIFVAKKKPAISPHGRWQMLKHFCLNLFISFCLNFDLVVNVLCLEIVWNLLGRHCERIGLSFRSVVYPCLSLCSSSAEDGNQYKSWNLFWVRRSIGCAQEHPSHLWGRRHTYIIADGYIVHSVSVGKGWNSEV